MKGVILSDGRVLRCSKVVVTTGTFLGGEIHIGLTAYPSGRMGEDATFGLSKHSGKQGSVSVDSKLVPHLDYLLKLSIIPI